MKKSSNEQAILLQERVDDFKKDIIEVCKRHKMGICTDLEGMWIQPKFCITHEIEEAEVGV